MPFLFSLRSNFEETPKQINPTGLAIGAVEFIFPRVGFVRNIQKNQNALGTGRELNTNCPNYSKIKKT